jgi:pyruvate dehydrogenase E2 component (dihydrolipoamide acetyltransferase)
MEILMPQLGQAMVSGVVVAWHVADGDEVQAGAPLITIESDKSAFDIESPATGVVTRHVAEGQEAEVGAVLGLIGAESAPSSPATTLPNKGTSGQHPPPPSELAEPGREVSASPRARAAARGKIPLAEVQPSRADGMITEEDVARAIKLAGSTKASSSTAPEAVTGRREGIGTAHRSAIKRLQRSWTQAPHIVQMIEVDAAALVEAQALIKQGVLKATLNDIIIKAAADVMATFPDLNAFIDGDDIVYSSDVDVSIAVATERGLRTPTLTSVAGLSLEEVADRTREAVQQARDGRSIMRRASFTVSNLGRYGIQFGSPVLNLDESVLIFVGAISEKPRVVSGAIEAAHELTLSIAYDHRIADGLRAAEFSAALRERLEQFQPGVPAPVAAADGRSVSLRSSHLKCELNDASGHRWVIDEPGAIGGTDRGPDPVTSVLGALLSCLTIAFRLTAERRGVPIEQLDGSISTPDSAKVQRIEAVLRVRSSADPEKVQALLKPAKRACYVHAMLKDEIDLSIRLDTEADGK